jgi:hypothetical protein
VALQLEVEAKERASSSAGGNKGEVTALEEEAVVQ